MIIDYNGSVQLWQQTYTECPIDIDEIFKKIKHLSPRELSDGKLVFDTHESLVVVKVSKDYFCEHENRTKKYRRLVRIETAGSSKIPENLTELLKRENFARCI